MAWYKNDKGIWAYLAGFIDSDGAICITKCRRYGNRTGELFLQPSIQFSNTNEGIFKYFQKVLKKYDFKYVKQEMGLIWKDRFHARIQRRSFVKEILGNILPFLVIKKNQAELVLAFINDRKNKCYHGYSDEAWECFNAIRILNKKGK